MCAHVHPTAGDASTRPFVPAFRAPVVQMISDAAIPQYLRHSIGGPAVLPWTASGHEPDVASGGPVESFFFMSRGDRR